MRRLSVIILGAVWGLGAALFFAGVGTEWGRGLASAGISYPLPDSFIGKAIRELVFHPRGERCRLVTVFALPFVFGLDLLIWTVGVLLWLPMRQGWPGTALFAFFGRHRRLAWAMLVFSITLSGIGLAWLVSWSLRLLAGHLRRSRSL